MPPHIHRKDRTAIACPRQRVVAAHIQELEDLFCAGFAALPPEQRLVALPGKASTPSDKLRNATRMMALGAIVRLGLDVGLGTHAMHGHAGHTEILELKPIHYGTTQIACSLFDAILIDGAEFAGYISERYRAILKKALAELAPLRRKEAAAERAKAKVAEKAAAEKAERMRIREARAAERAANGGRSSTTRRRRSRLATPAAEAA